MNKKLRVSLFFGLHLVFQLNAQSPADSLSLPELIISDNRMDVPFSALSRSIQVIRREEIMAAPANSLAEVLQYVPGLDVRQRGVNGAQADIGIRGGSFDQTLILINGMKISDLQTGHHSMNLPVDWETIDRIEVLKGPAARIYGQNAFAGAINIVTRAPEERFAKISAMAGDFGLGRLSAGISMPAANSRHHLSYAYDFADGYRYNTDYRMHTASYQSAFEGRGGALQLFAGWTGRDFGANGFYGSPSFTEQYERLHTTLIGIDARKTTGNWVFRPRLYWRFNEDEYIFTRSNPGAFRNFHKSHNICLELNTQYFSGSGITGIGLEFGRQLLFSNRLGDRDREVLNMFVEHRLQMADERLDLTPGMLFTYYSDFGAQWLPGIEGGWQFSEKLRAYGNVGYTFRVPTFTDLYYQDPGNLGNPELQPESAIAGELGLKYMQQHLLATLTLFNRRSDNLIDWTKADPAERWQTRNLGDVTFSGVEFFIEGRPAAFLPRAHLSYTFIDATQGVNDAFLSRYALDNLRHQVIAGLDFLLWKYWRPGVRYRFLDRVNLEDYQVLDARIRFQQKRWALFVEATNITNSRYTETNLVPMPGRWFSAGLNWKFGEKR